MTRLARAGLLCLVFQSTAFADGYKAHFTASDIAALCANDPAFAKEVLGPRACQDSLVSDESESLSHSNRRKASDGFDNPSAAPSTMFSPVDELELREFSFDQDHDTLRRLMDLGIHVTTPTLPQSLNPRQLIIIEPGDTDTVQWPGSLQPGISRFPDGCSPSGNPANLGPAFDQNCLKTVVDIPQEYRSAGIGQVLVSLLVFRPNRAKYTPECMGVRMTESLVLMAAHCIFERGTSFTSSIQLHDEYQALYGNPLIRFVDPDRVNVSYDALHQKATRVVGTQDLLWLPIQATQGGPPLPPMPQNGEDLQLVWDTSNRLGELDPLDAPNVLAVGPVSNVTLNVVPVGLQDTWMQNLRFSENPQCAIRHYGDNCALHTCQTTPSFSGTPLLFVKDNKIHVAGIHIGYGSVCGQANDRRLYRRVNIAEAPRHPPQVPETP